MDNLIANTVAMVRPAAFGFNEEAAESNAFQKRIDLFSAQQIQEIATVEFDNYAKMLKARGINVMVFDDQIDPLTPDAIFPNNWFSTCPHTKTIYTYPMGVSVRSLERRVDVINQIQESTAYRFNNSLVSYEEQSLALEGTGSLVLDHQNKIAYACLSKRTDLTVLKNWCSMTGFEPMAFTAKGDEGSLIYHTNVLMTMADTYCVICLDTIIDPSERKDVVEKLKNTNKTIINISIDQMNAFAGNMLQLQNKKGKKYLVMSSSAFRSLSKDQVETIEKTQANKIISVPINVIETIGGGSARCMVAEVFGTR